MLRQRHSLIGGEIPLINIIPISLNVYKCVSPVVCSQVLDVGEAKKGSKFIIISIIRVIGSSNKGFHSGAKLLSRQDSSWQ